MKHKNQIQNFEHDYINYYTKKVENLKKKYPEITKENRRTGRALKNICFFIWYYAKEEKDELIDLLFKASVLLSAQDNFFDNPQISDHQKKDFYSISVNVIEGNDYKVINRSPQFRELITLWKEITQEIRDASPHLYSYWEKQARQLNEAMENERYVLKRRAVALDEYMRTAVYSVGVIFILTTYLVKKNISFSALQKLESILLVSAKIARLSNDIASHRENKNQVNAMSIIRNIKNPKKYILELIKGEQQKLNRSLQELKIENKIKQTIQRFTEFLVGFYQTSDFDK